MQAFDESIDYLRQDSEAARMIDSLKGGSRGWVVVRTDNLHRTYALDNVVMWDPRAAGDVAFGTQSPAIRLGHELAHVAGPQLPMVRIPGWGYRNLEEYRVIRRWEVGVASRLGEGVRYDHHGHPFRVSGPLAR